MDGFTFYQFHAGWSQKVIHSCTIQQLKDGGLFRFMCRFGTTYHERVNKIHVHGSPFYPARNYENKIKSLVAHY